MKSKIGVAGLIGILAAVSFVPAAAAQCMGYPGAMIVFSSNGYAYETSSAPQLLATAAVTELTVVGKVSLFCDPFADLDASDPNTEYTFVWDGLLSLGTTVTPYGAAGTQYTTEYVGGAFRVYAGSPPDVPSVLPPLPSDDIPGTYGNGTVILSGVMGTLTVIVTKNSLGTYSGSFRTDYSCTGGTLLDRVGGGTDLLSGTWCPVPPDESAAPIGTCVLPEGWIAHLNGKWDLPVTVPALPATWGAVKTLYR